MAAPSSAPELASGPLDAAAAVVVGALRGLRSGVRLSLRTPAGRIGLPLVLLHLTLIFFGPWIAPSSPTRFHELPLDGGEIMEKALNNGDFLLFTNTGELPQDANRTALVQLQAAYSEATDGAGAVDGARAAASVAELELSWTPGQRAYVTNKTSKLRILEAPSGEFWFGTDNFGRDVLSRVMTGARSLISISVAGALLGIVSGTLVGLGSGFKGGRTDEVVMRVMDALMSFPSLLIALLVLTSLGPNQGNIIATIGVVFTAPVARVMRSVTLALKTQEFVESARLRGEPDWYITFREILPNAVPVLAVEASVRFSYAILLVSSLGFLGLGVQPPSSDWGLMIAESRRFIVAAPWVAIAPAAAVASLVVGVNLLVDGIRQARELPRVGS